jgi:hypothetical protein
MPDIERPEVTAGRLGVGKTKFDEDFVDHGNGKDKVPDTDIKRLKPVPLGKKAVGFLSDETDALIEALRRRRDSTPSPPRPEPKRLRSGRDAYWQEWRVKNAKKKRRAGTKRRAEQQGQGGIQPA